MKLFNMLALIASAFFTVQVFAAVNDIFTYNDDILPLFKDDGCTDCHSWAGNYSTLLARKSESSATSGTLIVKQNDSAGSVLIWRLNGEKPDGTKLSRMPIGGDPLSSETITQIEKWIDTGAPEVAVDVTVTTWGKLKSLFR